MSIKLDYPDKLQIAEYLARLDITFSPYADPFEPVKPSATWKALRLVLWMLSITLILGLLAVLDTIYGTAQDAFKTLLDPTISAWIRANPLTSLVIFLGLAILTGLLSWGLERLKSNFENRNKATS